MDQNSQEFRKVLYKRRGRRKVIVDTIGHTTNIETDQKTNISWISQAQENFRTSHFYNGFISLLEKSLSSTKSSKFDKIICFGLGLVSEQSCSRHQLSLLLCLRDHYRVEVSVSDPQFCKNDEQILKHFGIKVEENNLEAKYPANGCVILFYLPHCPKELSNNLLWSNWNFEQLKNCVIVCNSFKQIVDNADWKNFNSIEYIRRILPYCLEFDVENSFKYFEVFCDTSIHCFPAERLNKVPDKLWEDNEQPVYLGDSEYIKLIKTKS